MHRRSARGFDLFIAWKATPVARFASKRSRLGFRPAAHSSTSRRKCKAQAQLQALRLDAVAVRRRAVWRPLSRDLLSHSPNVPYGKASYYDDQQSPSRTQPGESDSPRVTACDSGRSRSEACFATTSVRANTARAAFGRGLDKCKAYAPGSSGMPSAALGCMKGPAAAAAGRSAARHAGAWSGARSRRHASVRGGHVGAAAARSARATAHCVTALSASLAAMHAPTGVRASSAWKKRRARSLARTRGSGPQSAATADDL